MDSLIWLAPALAVVALLFAFYKISFVSKQDAGTDRMKEISSATVSYTHLTLPTKLEV